MRCCSVSTSSLINILQLCLVIIVTVSKGEGQNSVFLQLTKYMFRAGNPFGVDLAAINIQRGRDHGLRPYNDYRELVGQTKIKSFDEFGEEV